MNYKKYSIFAVPVIAVLAVLAFSNEEQPTIRESQEPLRYTTLGEFGTSVDIEQISENAPQKLAQFKQPAPSFAELLEIRDDDGYVYFLYGDKNTNLDSDTKLNEFAKDGGIVVRTIVMTNPAVALEVMDKEADNYFQFNGMDAFWKDDNGYEPSSIVVYPGDERKITVYADGSKDEILGLVERLNIEPAELDLKKFPPIPYSPEPILGD